MVLKKACFQVNVRFLVADWLKEENLNAWKGLLKMLSEVSFLYWLGCIVVYLIHLQFTHQKKSYKKCSSSHLKFPLKSTNLWPVSITSPKPVVYLFKYRATFLRGYSFIFSYILTCFIWLKIDLKIMFGEIMAWMNLIRKISSKQIYR